MFSRHAICVFALLAVACSNSSRSNSTSMSAPAPPVVSAPRAPAVIHTWFDPEAAAAIMRARADFDAAEAAAFAELDRTIGNYRDVMPITRQQFNRQLAAPRLPASGSDAWRREQRKRATYAYLRLQPRIEAARRALTRATLAALASFFRRERQAGHISAADYRRYTVEIRRGDFPWFRGRKWSGPAVYEFRGADLRPEYQKVIQEVRRLWQAQGRRQSAVTWMRADPEFYRTLASPSR